MPAITFKVQVPNIEEVLQYYSQIRVLRSVTGSTGPFVEITTASTRINLIEGQTVYNFIDRDGSVSYYYQTEYFDPASDQASSRSDTIRGTSDANLDILSAEELRAYYLFGVDLRDDAGNLLPDETLEFYIRSAVAQAEQMLDLPIRRSVVEAVEPERQDFFLQEFYKYIKLQLNESPVISVERISLTLPTNNEVINFPLEWIQLDKESGQIHIIPGAGNASVVALGATGAWLPLVTGWADYLPHVFRCAYTAGFDPVPANLKDIIGKLASFGPLNIAGDLVLGAGIAGQQISIDGISTGVQTTQSATNSGYGARLARYSKELAVQIPEARRYFKGIRMQVG